MHARSTRTLAAVHVLEPRRLFAATPIDLDPTYGLNGIASDFLGGGTDNGATSTITFVMPLSSGKTLVGGEVIGQGAQLARLNADGTLDTTYATGGPGLSAIAALNSVTDGAIQSDGKVILVGDANNTPAIARFLPDGTLDTAFGDNGVVTAPIAAGATAANATNVLIQSDGKIILAGDATRTVANPDPTQPPTTAGFVEVARFFSNGSIDTAFDNDGVLIVDPLSAATGTGVTTVNDFFLSGGQFVFGGSVNGQGYVARYNTNGTADTSFASKTYPGFATAGDAGVPALTNVNRIVILSGGKYLLGGDTASSGGGVARLNADGTGDTGYGDLGIRTGVDDTVVDMLADSSGNLTTLGTSGGVASLRRIDSNGDFDLTFQTNGQLLINTLASPQQLIVQSDGKYLIPGISTVDNTSGVARLGPRPSSFLGSNGTLTLTGTGNADTVTVTTSGGKVVATVNGSSQSFTAAQVLRVDINTLAGDDNITVSVDSLTQPSSIDAGSGTDTVHLSNVAATITASGFLTVRAGNGGQTVQDSAGKMDVMLGNGDNVVQAGNQNDTIVTGTGNDQIFASGGADSVNAGDGNNVIQGGDGNDTLTGGAGVDVIYGNGGADSIVAGAGNDVVFGGDNPINAGTSFDLTDTGDVIDGGDGNDRLIGGAGNDTVIGGAQRDALVGGPGSDLLSGGGGKDKMSGDGGNDRLYGGASRDLMIGGAGNDRLFGQGGNDGILSGSGVDALNGGPGFDYLAGKPGDTHDTDSRDTLVGF